MGKYGGPTPKRHYAISNSPAIRTLDLGPLHFWKDAVKSMAEQGVKPVRLVKTYFDKQGKKRYQGLPALKSSEMLCLKGGAVAGPFAQVFEVLWRKTF